MGDVWERLLKERGYKIQHTLGEGAYSKVKSAYSSRLGREVAIKCINTQLAPNDFVQKFLPRELKTLPLLRHENIVRVYEILEYKPSPSQASDGYVYIVMESARNGDMLRYIQRKGALPEAEIRHYFYQLVQAVSYCHSQNICHRDLKCENLLLDKDFKLLLTDFGFSKSMIFNDNGRVTLSNTFCGSAAYAAPEIIQGQSYDPRMHDMWSLGVILYIMSCGHMPFDDSNVKKMLRVQLRNHLKFPPRVQHLLSDDLKHLIRSLIEPNVSQRANMEMVKRHPFLAGETGKGISVAKHIVDFFTGGGSSANPQTGATSGGGSNHDKASAAPGGSSSSKTPAQQQQQQRSSSGGKYHHHHHHHKRHADDQPRHSARASSPVSSRYYQLRSRDNTTTRMFTTHHNNNNHQHRSIKRAATGTNALQPRSIFKKRVRKRSDDDV